MPVKLRTPNKHYTGDIFGIEFVKGVAIVEDGKLAKYVADRFKYESEPFESSPEPQEQADEEDAEQEEPAQELEEPNYDMLTIPELQALLNEQGIEYGKKANKNQLIDLLKK